MKARNAILLAILAIVFLPGLAAAIEVEEAVMCSAVENREPVNPTNAFPADVGEVWCWSKIKGGEGTSIEHVYYYGGEEKATVRLYIGSPMWRTYSSKRILPSWTGSWRVDIVDADGNALEKLDFTVGEEVMPDEPMEEEPLPEAEETSDEGSAPKSGETSE